MDRGNHYETAFEAYLRDRRLGYVAVDESRRSSLDDEPVKSIDFIVYGHGGARLLVDIKGRKFPGGKAGKPRHVWQNWVFREDVEGLERWAVSFGAEYRGVLDFNFMGTILLYGFAAAALGGFDSIAGAVVGGLLVGLIETFVPAFFTAIGNELSLVMVLAVIMIILYFRPQGLFGSKRVERV